MIYKLTILALALTACGFERVEGQQAERIASVSAGPTVTHVYRVVDPKANVLCFVNTAGGIQCFPLGQKPEAPKPEVKGKK